MVERSQRRALLVSKGWVQAVGLVMLIGFFILGLLAYRTYTQQPPVPRTVLDDRGRVLYTGNDISQGSGGLPALRADGVRHRLRPRRLPRARLHRRLPAPRGAASCRSLRRRRGGPTARRRRRGTPGQPLRPGDRTAASGRRRRPAFRLRADPSAPTETASTTGGRDGTGCGPTPSPIADASCAGSTGFIAWTAWTAIGAAARQDVLLHQQLAAEALVGNTVTGEAIVWSALSLIALLGGIGIVLGALRPLRRTCSAGTSREERRAAVRAPRGRRPDPGAARHAWFFFVVAALFVLQNARRRR